MGKVIKYLLYAILLYGVGFSLFWVQVPAPREDVPEVDGLAVFTGGSNRVATGMTLLREGFAGPVLISGVHPDVRVEDLLGGQPLPGDILARLTLDIGAENTRQNVRNTLLWARNLQLSAADGKRVGIVTSTYHMPRVRWLMWWEGADVEPVYLPVRPDAVSWRDYVREYHKLLAWWWMV